ncbi:MAG: DoxX family protein [Saprospiraceae bacterium]|nr:DoxX family protein [Saprospiraceae bacterium]
MFQNQAILRWTLALILFMHSIPGMFNNGINDFGNLYLNQVGFDPFGVYLAWAIKLSHVCAAILFIINKYIKWAAWPTLLILVSGIFMVHLEHGWFVVGGGINGIEYNVLMIAVIVHLLIEDNRSKHF